MIVAVMVWDASFEVDRERLERLFPARTSGPDAGTAVLIEIAHREVEHLERGLFAGELAAVAGDLAQPGVDRLDQVRGVDHPPHRRRECQERHELCPVCPPQPHDRRIVRLPPAGEIRQGGWPAAWPRCGPGRVSPTRPPARRTGLRALRACSGLSSDWMIGVGPGPVGARCVSRPSG
jgi:hypothetical protein